MLRFIAALAFCVIIFKLSQHNTQYSTGILLLCAMAFIWYTITTLPEGSEEYRRKMLSDPKSRHYYYQMINS
jgi:hypothetical protein